MVYALLEVVTDPFGYSAIACVCLAVISFCMMVVGVFRSNAPRTRAAGLLVAGVAYAVVNAGAFIVTISIDAFAIFDVAYVLAVGIGGPALMVFALILVARGNQQLGWHSIAGFAVWTGCVGFAHLWVVAAASASV